MVNPRFHILVFVFGLNQEDYDTGGVQDSPMNPGGENLLFRQSHI